MCTSIFPVVDHPSSTNPRRSSTPSPSLQRGKACLSCRRRKMKCDGLKPVCTPCLRGERVEDCEYADGPRRPRTLTLEEDIARLKARVQELENPEEVVSSVQLHPPYADACATLSNAVSGSTQLHASSTASYHSMKHARSRGPQTDGSTGLHRSDFETDAHIHPSQALSVITPYVAEVGFFLDIDRLRAQGTHVLPALRSALALWSVHITSICESDHGQAHEQTQNFSSNLLSHTQTQLASALGTVDTEPDPAAFLHLVQAGILLAYYMQRIGQLIGARYYASGTWALAMMLKLYQRPHSLDSTDRVSREGAVRQRKADGNIDVPVFTLVACARWAQPLDDIEAEERVRAFWAVYTLDRWFGAVCEKSRHSFMTAASALNTITVPWPSAGGTQARSSAVQHFLRDSSHDFTQDGVAAMHAKASVLLGEATAIAASYETDTASSRSPAFRARFGALDALLQQCLDAVMAMSTSLNGHSSREEGQVLVTIHLIALAHVTLHRPFISANGPSRKRCIEGALGVVRVLDQIGPDVGLISPIYALLWTALCLELHTEVLRLRTRPDADPSRRREEGEMIQAIRRLVGVLSALSQRCPSRFFAANIEAVLPVLESIAT